MGIKIKHLWFGIVSSSINEKDCDIIFAHSLSKEYVSDKNALIKNSQYTLITDLTDIEECLFSAIKKNYRYEIKRCNRIEEEITYQYYDKLNPIDQSLLDGFENVYNQMYKDKGIKNIFNKNQVKNMIENESIVLFTIGFYRDIPLVFHSYVYSQNDAKVRFYYSASPFRQEKLEAERIGRINKGLHWFDLKTFKEQGIKLYDWGGIANPDNPDGIGKFKLSFGGKVELLHNVMMGKTLKGKFIIMLLKNKK